MGSIAGPPALSAPPRAGKVVAEPRPPRVWSWLQAEGEQSPASLQKSCCFEGRHQPGAGFFLAAPDCACSATSLLLAGLAGLQHLAGGQERAPL